MPSSSIVEVEVGVGVLVDVVGKVGVEVKVKIEFDVGVEIMVEDEVKVRAQNDFFWVGRIAGEMENKAIFQLEVKV